jgi:hypothetical protein
MQLELATTEEIADELLRRPLRFVFLAFEDTNTTRPDLACISGKGITLDDVPSLLEFARDVLNRGHDESGNSGSA